MAELIDDDDNQSNEQGSIPRGVLVILAIAIAMVLDVLRQAWLAMLAIIPIVIQAYICYMGLIGGPKLPKKADALIEAGGRVPQCNFDC